MARYVVDSNDSRQYIQMLQGIINRMASNSSNCKAWAITLFTAMAALLVGVPALRQWMIIIIVPSIVFYLLDAYYLALENNFRDLEDFYIEKLHSDENWSNFVYNFNYKTIEGYNKWKNLRKGLGSKATYPQYLVLVLISLMTSIYFYNVAPTQTKEQEIEEPLRQLVIKQDSIACTLNSFVNKYQPVKVDKKTFNNSSFFQADNIDSVHVNLYKGIVK